MANRPKLVASRVRAIYIAWTAFACVALIVGLADRNARQQPPPVHLTSDQMQIARADIKFGFARQNPGDKLTIDPF